MPDKNNLLNPSAAPSETENIVGGTPNNLTLPEEGIGARIRQARESKGYTQETLSRLTVTCDPEKKGISRSVLAYYEKGKYKPGSRELRILYFALGLTPNWLVLGKNDPERLRQFRELFGSEEAFFSGLTENLRKLDSDSLNGIANLVFLAADNIPAYKEQTDRFADMFNEAVVLAEELKGRIDKLEENKNKSSISPKASIKDSKSS